MIETNQKPEGADKTAVETTKTLADVLKEHGTLPEPELFKTFLQVLGDLESAHGQQILHRDISPTRIILNSGGTWKLTDYGLAKVGTVRYMSPERCQGKPLDVRSDIYSLGAVLFEATTGSPPFNAEMKFQIMEAHVSTPPPSPRAMNPAVTAELEQVILRALAKNPADRFQNSGEFRRALAELAGVSDQSPTPPERPAAESVEGGPAEAASGSRRTKLVAILVPLAGVITVVVVLFLTGVIGSRRVPAVTGMGRDEAESVLRGKGLRAEIDSVDDTLASGTVAAQLPAAGVKVRGSRAVKLSVSTGMVTAPTLTGLPLADARARLARLALTAAKVDTQYSDDHGPDTVVSSGLKAGTKVAPGSRVSLTVSSGRATCPECGARREAGAKFCTRCGYKY